MRTCLNALAGNVPTVRVMSDSLLKATLQELIHTHTHARTHQTTDTHTLIQAHLVPVLNLHSPNNLGDKSLWDLPSRLQTGRQAAQIHLSPDTAM